MPFVTCCNGTVIKLDLLMGLDCFRLLESIFILPACRHFFNVLYLLAGIHRL